MPVLIDLFLTFAKIGLFTFGGGYAMISLIENDCVEKKKWITHDEMMDVTVIAESTPQLCHLCWIQKRETSRCNNSYARDSSSFIHHNLLDIKVF